MTHIASTLRRCGEIVLFFLVALSLVGCFPGDQISWSSDGRYMAFIGPDDDALWVCDTRTGESKRLTGKGTAVENAIMCVRFVPNGTSLVFGETLEGSGSDSVRLREVDVEKPGEFRDVVAKTEWGSFDISPDGRFVFAIEEEKDGEGKLSEIDLSSCGHKTILPSVEAGFLAVDPSCKRFLLSANERLVLIDRDTATTRLLLSNAGRSGDNSDYNFWCPKWIDEKNFLFVQSVKADNDEDGMGKLVACSLDRLTTRLLCPDVYVFAPISLSADGRLVAVTTLAPKEERFQVAIVDTKTGKKRMETNEPFHAWFGGLDPAAKRLAVETGKEDELDDAVIRILDLESGKKRTVWRNEEERLYAAAEDFAEEGDAAQSLAFCQDLLTRFPESRLKDAVRYRMLNLYLSEPLLDLDKAYGVLKDAGTTQLDEWKHMDGEISRLLWPEECRVATDPAADWITTYSTEAARKEFKFDTEQTRDLRGLWVRAGKDRLYVRVGYESNRDLSGLTFQDTLLLFRTGKAESSDTSDTLRRISEGADWDRTPERSVLFRHWYPSANGSQYDVEIRDGKGEMVSRFLASGFAPPGNPLFDVPVCTQNAKGEESVEGSVVYAISRQALGLSDGYETAIQVCTFKGGIESRKGLEHPRPTVAASRVRPFCDVADAFGTENTRERIENDLGAAETSGARIATRGVAGTFVVPRR
jgi:hypothetical protein